MNYDFSFNPSLSANIPAPSSFQDKEQLRQYLLPTLKNWFTSNHPKLMELGFLDYVGQIRNEKHQKLFPSLKKMRSTGYGTLISRWFARYL